MALDLTSKGINTLPSDIGKLNKLEDLNLYINNLTRLPEEIWDITNLTYLHLGDNNLTGIPAEIGSLNNLKVLKLAENNLDSLPEEIGKLNNLDVLNLFKNNLTDLPDSIVNIGRVIDDSYPGLDVRYNKLCSLLSEVKEWVDFNSKCGKWHFWKSKYCKHYWNMPFITKIAISIRNSADNITVKRCFFLGEKKSRLLTGIYLGYNTDSLTVENCIFSGLSNAAITNSNGCSKQSGFTVINNTFYKCGWAISFIGRHPGFGYPGEEFS